MGTQTNISDSDKAAEEHRILRAAADGRMFRSASGRIQISGEAPPAKNARAAVQRKGWITWATPAGLRPTLTAEGAAALRILDASEQASTRGSADVERTELRTP